MLHGAIQKMKVTRFFMDHRVYNREMQQLPQCDQETSTEQRMEGQNKEQQFHVLTAECRVSAPG